jgi:carboxyl-terminal processing protease
VALPIEASASSREIELVLREGAQFEQERRWLDALSHYEKAVRDFPDRRDLQDRLTLSHIHCDIARRYADRSYRQLVSRFDATQAMAVYTEVLQKIETHYVDDPQWQDMVWRGTANLDVALTKKPFRDVHLPTVTERQVNAFRHELRRSINTRRVGGRDDSRAVVSQCSRIAGQRLGLRSGAVIFEYVCGAISSLDPYSTYLTGSQLDDVYNQIEGSFVGLGIELKSEDDALRIVKTIPGGPADRAGIVGGDRIVEVDGQPTNDVTTDEAADMLKGEEGSTVTVAVLGPDSRLRRLAIVREEVEVPSVEDVRMLERANGIGYFRLANFQKTTSRDVDAALWKLQQEGMRSLIIDLRGNPGGLLTAAVEAADKFIQNGMIVSTRGRSQREDFDYRAHRVGTWPVPLVVMIDDETASASEIFAGAVSDHRRATIVGQRSYGKGSVQGIFPLQLARAGVRLTTAKFYSPNGQPISHRGVAPNVTVRQAQKPVSAAELDAQDSPSDPVLTAALEVARRQVLAHRPADGGQLNTAG